MPCAHNSSRRCNGIRFYCARRQPFRLSATGSVVGGSKTKPSTISMPGAIPNFSICWAILPRWCPLANPLRGYRSACKSSDDPGKKSKYCRWPQCWSSNVARGGFPRTHEVRSRFGIVFLHYSPCANTSVPWFARDFNHCRTEIRRQHFDRFQMREDRTPQSLVRRALSWLLPFLVVSAAYLYTFPQANVSYAGVVLLHALAGVIAAILLVPALFRLLRNGSILERAGWLIIAAGAVLGLILIKTGTPRTEWKWLYLHIVISLVGVGFLIANRLGRRGHSGAGAITVALRAGLCRVVIAILGYGAPYIRESWQTRGRIQNPAMPPEDMNGEGDGPEGSFFPSSAQVYGKQKIPSKFFMESDSCKRCHEDIYNQWFSSAHHFSSFNNQWYRKSIEYMQDTIGTTPSKWCGGCHDPAVLYSGLMDTPIKQIVHRPESQAGLGCMMCHSIAEVKSTMGQGDFYLEYPKLHELAATQNPVGRALHDFVIRLNPETHLRVFLKQFMKTQTAEFCSTCHKVHLDVPVNHYRWFRGFNEYDNWQASGVSGQGARSFYYPPKPQQCADCHMPMESSKDAGNINGFVHSHRFPGANTAIPTANEDAAQLKLTEGFLKSGALTVDIFAMSPAQEPLKSGATTQAELNTTFAVGEEAETKITPGTAGEGSRVTAPLNSVLPALRRGDTVRVDVVVRTKKVGHFFPGGTVDAYDTWLELKGADDKGQTIFWSGMVEGDGKGPVEKGAHFYRSLQVDAHGNPINKRNAWATRAVVYVRLIPPGAA